MISVNKSALVEYSVLILSTVFLIFSLATSNVIVGLCGFVLAMKASTYPRFSIMSRKKKQ